MPRWRNRAKRNRILHPSAMKDVGKVGQRGGSFLWTPAAVKAAQSSGDTIFPPTHRKGRGPSHRGRPTRLTLHLRWKKNRLEPARFGPTRWLGPSRGRPLSTLWLGIHVHTSTLDEDKTREEQFAPTSDGAQFRYEGRSNAHWMNAVSTSSRKKTA